MSLLQRGVDPAGIACWVDTTIEEFLCPQFSDVVAFFRVEFFIGGKSLSEYVVIRDRDVIFPKKLKTMESGRQVCTLVPNTNWYGSRLALIEHARLHPGYVQLRFPQYGGPHDTGELLIVIVHLRMYRRWQSCMSIASKPPFQKNGLWSFAQVGNVKSSPESTAWNYQRPHVICYSIVLLVFQVLEGRNAHVRLAWGALFEAEFPRLVYVRI